ncbi:MAG: PAS domain-containing sensor histidine kinase, partial [Campylobacterota bacterium]|nr:PAS domain-containing sensor histidine kinase [Campylobacterota bacterium]
KIGHWRVDIESDTITCSKEILKMFDLVGHENSLNLLTLRQKVHPEDVEKVVASLQKAKKDSNYKHDIAYRVIKKDGSISWIHCREKLNSEKSLVEGTMLDITNLKNTQIVLEKQKEILLSQSKAAMMGEMIGLIAHQFRQPLSIISMLSSNELASLELEESVTNDQIRNSANETLNQVEYLSKTIETFRDFLHSDNKKVEDNIKNAIENSIAIVNKSLSNHNIELIKEYNSDIELYISNSELMQVFINLLNNSKDAFDINSIENRKIMIRTYDKDENVIIEIEDNAGGILQADIENIFDAYFTTKSKSGGTGLGLYIVQIIIKEHFDGTIEARNIYSDDKTTGVQFSITIPLK